MSYSRANSVFGALPFDKHVDPRTIAYVENFIGAGAVADGDGDVIIPGTKLFIDEGGGDSAPSVTKVSGVANHQGIVAVGTGATTAADGDIAAVTFGPVQSTPLILDDNGLYAAVLLRIPDVSDTKVQFGFAADNDAAVNSSQDNFVGFVFDPEDTANVGDELFFLQSNKATVDEEQVFSLAYVENDWVLLEIAATDAEAVLRITTEDGSEMLTTKNGVPTVAVGLGVVVEAVGAAEETVQIDTFVVRGLVGQTPSAGTFGTVGGVERMLVN